MPGAQVRVGVPLPDGRDLRAEEESGRLWLSLDTMPLGCFAMARESSRATLTSLGLAKNGLSLWAASYWLFAQEPPCEEILWKLPDGSADRWEADLLAPADGGMWRTRRDRFWQLPRPWLCDAARAAQPKPQGELYRRFDNRLGQWISLRTLDLDLDLERFNRWQNVPRVLRFWQEGGTVAQHRLYLARIAEDRHVFSVIGCFDNEPFGYFEVYWARDDRIAPFYAVGEHDRGLHMLVGEERHRGPHKVASWLPALTHYMFLADPRTGTVVAEPRADNARMIEYMRQAGFHKEKEFDFPHKRAALMKISRDHFFEQPLLF